MSTLASDAASVSSHTIAQRPPPTATPPGEVDALNALREHATLVRARRRQRLALNAGQGDVVYIVRAGLLGFETAPHGKHRQLLTLLYPGDIVRNSFLPDLPAVTLSALALAEIWRLPARTFDGLVAANPALAAHAQRRLAEQHARATLHASIIGALNGEERVASLLIELGLRLGTAGPGAVSFETPLSRADIADHLALNADTLSRITSRFKARGLLMHARSGHIVLSDWKGLCDASPVAATLLTLHEPRAR